MIAPNTTRPLALQPLEYLRVAYTRHKTKFRIAFFGTATLVAVGVFFMPKTYESEAKLFVRVGRESVTLDPTAASNTGQTISYYDSRESEITSVLDVLQSRVIMEKVVDQLGANDILGGGNDRESAIRKLTNTMNVSHAKKSSVISVTCRAATPEVAQRIVHAFVTVFNEEHLSANRTKGSHEFFVDQSETLLKQLTEARKTLADAKSAVGIVSLEGQRKLLQDQIGVTLADTSKTSADLGTSEAKVVALKSALAKVPERVLTQEVTGFFDDSAERTRQQLYQHQIHERELLARLGENHPQVLTVRNQINEAKRILAEIPERSKQSTNSTNPTYQALEGQLLAEQSIADSLRGRLKSLGVQNGKLGTEIAALNEHEGRITDMSNSVELLQANYKSYNERLEQARIDQALEDRQISNVNVVQPATLVDRPVGPRKLFVFAVGLLVAVLNGVGVVVASEYLAGRFKPNTNTLVRPELQAALMQ